ncbi:hypothetical protein MAPG_09202 [Magnaporthiopsis poae ATCC 64411]|uniref:Uncharacterized protein n=1 Tax=Magnaporthiopsis poae (strain ATCC 64411 / 73-15) TaxID=644358 RepID=A0A0C4E9C2_MAGP6|nr:hypothetical protein MAPG_09202 [Magnaporthiopsis poae ATCC 64411]
MALWMAKAAVDPGWADGRLARTDSRGSRGHLEGALLGRDRAIGYWNTAGLLAPTHSHCRQWAYGGGIVVSIGKGLGPTRQVVVDDDTRKLGGYLAAMGEGRRLRTDLGTCRNQTMPSSAISLGGPRLFGWHDLSGQSTAGHMDKWPGIGRIGLNLQQPNK